MLDKTGFNQNTLIFIFAIVLLIAVVYYLNSNNEQPIHNDGVIGSAAGESIVDYVDRSYGSKTSYVPSITNRPANPPLIDNRKYSDPSDSIVDDIIAQYTVEDRPMEGGTGSFAPADPMAGEHGVFDNYGKKKQLNMKKMELPYYEDEYDPRDFSYKKKRFSKRTPDDVKELFDINKMLPQEVEEDWFDVEPLLTTKKIKGTHLIHPKVHMGVNTVGNSLKNGTHDIRGDIANPKINVSPWLQSSIEPDTNIKGICNPI
uniref:Minor capsid protein P11 C-terminal conserved region domain-containing protein n=1 Tax=viral metagenome TaxID=1070528 RepID=A0A6C0LR33_9ZZZZ